MYDAFNEFLNVDTWHTYHPCDDERFYSALSTVINEPGFSPEDMAEYMYSYHGMDRTDNSAYSHRIESLRSASGHIQDYLKCVQKGLVKLT